MYLSISIESHLCLGSFLSTFSKIQHLDCCLSLDQKWDNAFSVLNSSSINPQLLHHYKGLYTNLNKTTRPQTPQNQTKTGREVQGHVMKTVVVSYLLQQTFSR